jgi:hypothetical protein
MPAHDVAAFVLLACLLGAGLCLVALVVLSGRHEN